MNTFKNAINIPFLHPSHTHLCSVTFPSFSLLFPTTNIFNLLVISLYFLSFTSLTVPALSPFLYNNLSSTSVFPSLSLSVLVKPSLPSLLHHSSSFVNSTSIQFLLFTLCLLVDLPSAGLFTPRYTPLIIHPKYFHSFPCITHPFTPLHILPFPPR